MILVDEFNNTWNYTFIIVSLIAITVGTVITLHEMKVRKYSLRREKRSKIKEKDNKYK